MGSLVPPSFLGVPSTKTCFPYLTLTLAVDDLHVQHSQWVTWNMTIDMFTFAIPESQKPFSPRGVLSTMNTVLTP